MTTLTNFSFFKLFSQHVEIRKPQKKNTLKMRLQHHREYQKMAELPDYLLTDMGITRADLEVKRSQSLLWQ